MVLFYTVNVREYIKICAFDGVISSRCQINTWAKIESGGGGGGAGTFPCMWKGRAWSTENLKKIPKRGQSGHVSSSVLHLKYTT